MLSITQDKDTSKLFLFLKPYTGPITDSNAYIITGVYQGKFKISKAGELIYDAEKYGGVNLYQKEFVPIKLKDAKEKIKKLVEISNVTE
ncbi:MAG TPA: hypothetical protein IAA29_19610 [Candidatus Paenibacillus intestinavium]|nr:hypothetical protein [Candidatus Paenibacillus intestinavium]